MENIFFNLDEDFEAVAFKVFNALGVTFSQAGSSENALNGTYSSFSVFGVNVKLEENSYDYEDEYRYMISVYKDRLTELLVDESVVTSISRLVVRLLTDNLHIKVGIEVEGELKKMGQT